MAALLSSSKGVVVLVAADPVPDVCITIDDINGAVAPSDPDGTTSLPMMPAVRVIERMIMQRRIVRVAKERAERRVGEFLNLLGKRREQPLVLQRPDVADGSPLDLLAFSTMSRFQCLIAQPGKRLAGEEDGVRRQQPGHLMAGSAKLVGLSHGKSLLLKFLQRL